MQEVEATPNDLNSLYKISKMPLLSNASRKPTKGKFKVALGKHLAPPSTIVYIRNT
jgi:hypothetical protein